MGSACSSNGNDTGEPVPNRAKNKHAAYETTQVESLLPEGDSEETTATPRNPPQQPLKSNPPKPAVAWGGLASDKKKASKDEFTKVDEFSPIQDEPPRGGDSHPKNREKKGPIAAELEAQEVSGNPDSFTKPVRTSQHDEISHTFSREDQNDGDDMEAKIKRRDMRINALCIKLRLNSKKISSQMLRPGPNDELMQELKQLLMQREQSP